MMRGSAFLVVLLLSLTAAGQGTGLSCSYFNKKTKLTERFSIVFDESQGTVSIDGSGPLAAKINESAIEFPSNVRGYTVNISRISGAVSIGPKSAPRTMQGSCTRSAQRF